MANVKWLVSLAVLGAAACAPHPSPVAGSARVPTITWNADVQPIVSTHCAGCHTGGAVSGGLSLDPYRATFASDASTACSGLTIAEAVATKVTADWSAACTGSQMPLGGEKLSTDQQEILRGWADAGAPE